MKHAILESICASGDVCQKSWKVELGWIDSIGYCKNKGSQHLALPQSAPEVSFLATELLLNYTINAGPFKQN